MLYYKADFKSDPMWPSMTFEFIFHLMKNLRRLDVSLCIEFYKIIRKRIYKKEKNPVYFLVRCKRTSVLNNNINNLRSDSYILSRKTIKVGNKIATKLITWCELHFEHLIFAAEPRCSGWVNLWRQSYTKRIVGF